MSRHEQYPLPQHSTMYNGTHAAIMESPYRFKKCMEAMLRVGSSSPTVQSANLHLEPSGPF